jgi:hypothetical protein
MNNNNLNNEQPLPLQEKADLLDEQSLRNANSKKGKNKKHNSAMTAASVSRSAVGHARSHTITNKPGDFAHSGTNISYNN